MINIRNSSFYVDFFLLSRMSLLKGEFHLYARTVSYHIWLAVVETLVCSWYTVSVSLLYVIKWICITKIRDFQIAFLSQHFICWIFNSQNYSNFITALHLKLSNHRAKLSNHRAKFWKEVLILSLWHQDLSVTDDWLCSKHSKTGISKTSRRSLQARLLHRWFHCGKNCDKILKSGYRLLFGGVFLSAIHRRNVFYRKKFTRNW